MTTRLVLSPDDHTRAVAALIERTPVFLTAPFRCNGLDIARQLYIDYDAAAPLSDEELVEVEAHVAQQTRAPKREGTPWERPLRAPHHTAPTEKVLREWELATHGVLILDELAEFRRATLDGLEAALREPKPGPSLIMIHTQCACGSPRQTDPCRPAYGTHVCDCPPERRAKWHGRVANLRAMSLQLPLVVEENAELGGHYG